MLLLGELMCQVLKERVLFLYPAIVDRKSTDDNPAKKQNKIVGWGDDQTKKMEW